MVQRGKLNNLKRFSGSCVTNFCLKRDYRTCPGIVDTQIEQPYILQALQDLKAEVL